MDENKQIEEIAKDLCPLYEKYKSCKTCDAVLGVGEEPCVYKCMAELITTKGYRKQEWISVEERLPELEGKARTWGKLQIQPSVRVLCTCVQKSGKVLVKEGFYELWGDRVVWKIPGSIDSVTHWMPLPEPPKMKGE